MEFLLLLLVGGFFLCRWAWRVFLRLLGFACLTLAELIRILFFPQRESVWDVPKANHPKPKLTENAITEEEKHRRIRAMRFMMTPDTTDLSNRDGTPKPWILSAYDYPAQLDEDGNECPRRVDLIIDAAHCAALDRGETPPRRTLHRGDHQVIAQLGDDRLVVTRRNTQGRTDLPTSDVIVRIGQSGDPDEVCGLLLPGHLLDQPGLGPIRLAQDAVDRALALVAQQ